MTINKRYYKMSTRKDKGGETMENNLAALRKQKNITQTELAKKAGIARSTICAIESNNRGVTAKTMIRIAEALGVQINDIFNL